jgi:putative ABC transport system ATP-binding protein
MIELNNIHVTFHAGTATEKQALRGIHLKIPAGEFLTVIGSNGAGKSTLLSIITGNVLPDQGTVVFEGVDVSRWSVEKRSTYVGRVFQDPLEGTCGALTIEENLALALKRGQKRGFRQAIPSRLKSHFQDILSQLNMGLENHLEQPIGLLSGGQRQAVSLMMAVLSPMKILVLDEHTAALDPKSAALIIQLTRQIVADKKLTALMVTHSMHQALEVGDRTIMLNNGQIIEDLSQEQRQNLTSQDLLKLFEEFDG